MKPRILFVTGTNTGAGKTVLATLLVRHLCARGISVAAFKPVCSGGRDDAKALHAALGGSLTLDEINPWHFRAALTPLLAARAEKKKVTLTQVTAHARQLQKRFPVLIVEGAGGLLSPLGEDFDSRDLIARLDAIPVVVAPDCLGVINQLLLTLEALPRARAQKAQVVLVKPERPDSASFENLKFLAARLGARRVHALPRIKFDSAVLGRQTKKTLDDLISSLIS